MEPRIILALALIVVAGVVAWVIERRRPDPPPRDAYPVPRQLDRDDFSEPDKPWLVVLFSSATCESCAELRPKVAPLASARVAVDDVDFATRPDLHERYGVEAVPMTLVVDAEGVVEAAFLGRVTATDLWAAVAEAREHGSTPEPGLGSLDD